MSELYRLLSKRSPKVEKVSGAMIAYEEDNTRFWATDVPMVSDDVEVGLEIEVEKVGGNYIHQYPIWERKQDGSLRDGGLEYVSSPIKGRRIPFAVNQFYHYLNGGARFSPRTSIHVHMNMLDCFLPQIGSTLLAYSVVERLLYKFVGGDRDKNNFCVPWYDGDCYDYINHFVTDSWTLSNQESNRYSGLNIASLLKFGTLEFRHLGGTKDKTKILKWINLLICLKQFGMRHNWKVIKHRIDRLNTTSEYQAFVSDVFGECERWLDRSQLRKDMELAVSRIKKVPLGESNKLWEKVKALPVKHSHWYDKISEVKKVKKVSMEHSFNRPAPARPPRPRGLVRPRRDPEEIREEEYLPDLEEFDENPPPPAGLRWVDGAPAIFQGNHEALRAYNNIVIRRRD